MALSGTWSFTVVRDDIIRESMLNIGAIGEAEVPTAQEVIDCARKLNMMVKSWMGFQDFAPGLKMWERQRAALFLSSSRGIYTLGGNSSDHWASSYTGGNLPGQLFNTSSMPLGGTAASNILNVQSTVGMNIGDFYGVEGPNDLLWYTISGINSSTVVSLTTTLGTDISPDATVYTYTKNAQRPLAIVTCVLRDSFNQDIPIRSMTLQDYEMLPTKAQSTYIGDPTAYYYESSFVAGSSPAGGGTLYLDIGGAQDITKHLHIVYMRPVMDFNNPGDNPEYPQQWYRALCWGLSKEICGMFDATWTSDMEENRKEAIAFAKEADAETTSMYFQPYANDSFGA